MSNARETRYSVPWRDRLAKAAQPAPMSRKDRYAALLPFYTEEGERYEALNKRAAAYLTVLGGLAVVAVFKLDSVAATKILSSPATLWLGLAAGVASIVAVVFVALSLRIENYQTLVDPQELILTSDRENYTEEDVYTVLLGGLAEATSINRKINDHRAGKLQWALWLAVTSAILVIATNLSIFLLLTTKV